MTARLSKPVERNTILVCAVGVCVWPIYIYHRGLYSHAIMKPNKKYKRNKEENGYSINKCVNRISGY